MVDYPILYKVQLMIKNIITSPDITYILQSFISLGLVIGLIYLSAFLYKKLTMATSKKINNTKEEIIDKNKLNIVSSLPLGNNKSLYVVEINGKTLLLGVCENNISLIKELSTNTQTSYKNVQIKDNVKISNNSIINSKEKEETKEQQNTKSSADELNELIRICNKYL